MKAIGLIALISLCACNATPTRPINNKDTIGIGTETSSAIKSQLHHARNISIMTAQSETTNALKLPNGYSDIPRVAEADDGRGADSPVVRAVRPPTECGLEASFGTLAARIRDCATKNPNHYEWKGAASGNAGEGTWKLVARSSSAKEIWLDETTGMIWSDVVSSSSNWCQASGNDESPFAPATIDCNVVGAGDSKCSGASILGIPASEISWRLPTRGDLLQADLNGSRFVLPRTDAVIWTATLNGLNRDQAWAQSMTTGILSLANRDTNLSVRCLGRRLK
ncbi:MAG: DUF1566 domain-containing protein [Bacteriovoracaceae bacterium]|nr:DUF1566 domain-containing protein [Bacteriovoracaceae bacterium]